jgi:hypothetical protein
MVGGGIPSDCGFRQQLRARISWARYGAFYVGSFYNNYLLATLHETGGKRHIRSRDLAGHILGMPKMLMEAASQQIHQLLNEFSLYKQHC